MWFETQSDHRNFHSLCPTRNPCVAAGGFSISPEHATESRGL